MTTKTNSSIASGHSSQPNFNFGSLQWRRWFMLSAGGILMFGGITKLLNVIENTQKLDVSDPILLIPFWQLLLCIGIVELIVAYLCLFTNKRILSLGLIAWLITIYGLYRVGLWGMGWYHPYPLLANLVETLDISPILAEGIAAAIAVFLFIGSIRMFWVENIKNPATVSS